MAAEINLSNGSKALVSDADAQLVNQYRWRASKQSKGIYVLTKINKVTVYLHRLITNAPRGLEVDHINGNPLDNRRENLRICSRSENEQNKVKRKGSSQYKGVFYAKREQRWIAKIQVNGRQTTLGYFKSEHDAARIYDAKARELFGAFARTNFSA